MAISLIQKTRDARKASMRRAIIRTLRKTGGNRTHAAEALGMQRTYLVRLIGQLGIVEPRQRLAPSVSSAVAWRTRITSSRQSCAPSAASAIL